MMSTDGQNVTDRVRPPEHGVATWGDLQPRRVNQWREDDDGKVAIFVPRFGRGRVGQKLQSWFQTRPYQVHLDDVGTFVWRQCDGNTRVSSIASAMREHFGDRVEPVEDRLVAFLQQLVRGRFISVDSGGPTSVRYPT